MTLHGRRGRLGHERVRVPPQQVRREGQRQPGSPRRRQRHGRDLHGAVALLLLLLLLRGRQHRRQPLDRLLVWGRQSRRRRCRLRCRRCRRLDVPSDATSSGHRRRRRRSPALEQVGQRADGLLKVRKNGEIR